ncbi:MAG TPA: MFS transporter [Candidatus Nanoarchaeia archaeon]|nr:MFS transporter [Candidatus Nanoarchaeia archaeon]
MSFDIKSKEPEGKKIKRSLTFSIIDGSFFNIMDGFTTPFIAPYALFLKASNIVISLLASVPDLLASIFQLSAIKANEVFKSRKPLIFVSMFLQALLWLPLMMIPKLMKNGASGTVVLGFMVLISMLGYFVSPLWRGMMGDLVAEHERGRFFSKRNQIIAVVGFVSTFAAGWILQHYSVTDALKGFTILFVVAFIARAFSALFLLLMYEKKTYKSSPVFPRKDSFTLISFLKNLKSSDYGRFVLFVCIFRITISLASPFFVVYELTYLKFSYLQFTILSAAEILASLLLLGFWGRMNDNQGSKMVMLITGLLIPLIPLLYIINPNFYFLLIVSLLSGAAWGGFNLAVSNFMFDASTPDNRVKYVAYFNLLHGIAIFLGATTGGLLLKLLGDNVSSIKALFIISGLARLGVALFLFPTLREMRIVQVSFDKKMFNYSVFIKPRQGFVEDPFDYYLAFQKQPRNHFKPRLYIDKQLVDDSHYKEPFEEKVKEHAKYKNFIQVMLDNSRKKK